MFESIELLTLSRLSLVTLLHFVWQATLVVGIVALVRGLLHPRRSQVRYVVCVTGMLLVLAAPIATISYYLGNPQALSTLDTRIVEATQVAAPSSGGSILEQTESLFLNIFFWFDQHRNYWLGAWLIGFVLLVARLCHGLDHCLRLRHSQRPLPPQLQQIANELKLRMKLSREVVVASSERISQAIATGVVKPIVLLPAGWITQLPMSAIEAVIAHELAHVKRWDLWINHLQRFAETVFFFHPLVWWLSRQVTGEREICCDRLAVTVTGQPMEYVETLAMVADRTAQTEFNFQFGTAFTGEKNMNLLRRAKLILEPGKMESHFSLRSLSLIFTVALMVTYGSYAYCTAAVPAAMANQEQDHDHDPDDEHHHADGEHRIIVQMVEGHQEKEGNRILLERVHGDQGKVDQARLHRHLIELLHEDHGNVDKAKLHRHLIELLHSDDNQQVDHKKLAVQLRQLADRLEHGASAPHRIHRAHTDGETFEIRVADDGRIEQNVRRARSGVRGGDRRENVELDVRVSDPERVEKVKRERRVIRHADGDGGVVVDIVPEIKGDKIELKSRVRRDAAPQREVYELRKSDYGNKQNVIIRERKADGFRAPVRERRDDDLGAAIRALREEVKQLRREMQQLRSGKQDSSDKNIRLEWRDDGQRKDANLLNNEVIWQMKKQDRDDHPDWRSNDIPESSLAVDAVLKWVEHEDKSEEAEAKSDRKDSQRFSLEREEKKNNRIKN